MTRYFLIFILALLPSISFAQGKITRNNQTTSKPNHTTISVSGSLNGHDYVDLGLPSGRRWATCNIGSKSPAGYGDYFAWAETKPKDSYTEANYSGCIDIYIDGLGDIKSDTVRCQYRIIDNPRFDAARKSWGENWELPTAKDFAELNKECSWTLKSIDGHKGYLITGPNGNSIFLPMAGLKENQYKSQVGTGGFYWTGDSWDARDRSTMVDFHKSSHNGSIWCYRYKGLSIRPVVSLSKFSSTQISINNFFGSR